MTVVARMTSRIGVAFMSASRHGDGLPGGDLDQLVELGRISAQRAAVDTARVEPERHQAAAARVSPRRGAVRVTEMDELRASPVLVPPRAAARIEAPQRGQRLGRAILWLSIRL